MPGSARTATRRAARLRRAVSLSIVRRRLRMPSRREAIAPTVDRILDAVKEAGLPRERRLDLAVAVTEALSNAAVHGNKLRPGSQVAITVTVIRGQQATVSVKDSGAGFDHSTLVDPTDAPNLLAPSGRGIFLMRRLVDRLEIEPPGNGVRLTMRKRR
jgi:serine/threonine-protein kinase RsbW